MSIKTRLGAAAMASTALVASSCSIAEFDALMIVLRDLDYNDAEINQLLKDDSVDIAKYFVERRFERSQWKAVTASVGYKEELIKTYVPMVQKFDAASEDPSELSTRSVVQRTSVSEIIGLTNGLAEVGYDERSLEKITDRPISLDTVNTINDSALVPALIEDIIGSDNVKTDSIGNGQTLLDKYIEFADIVSDGRSEDFMKDGDFDVTTIANSVNLLNDLGMTDFEENNFEPSAAMAISEYLDGEYNRIKAAVWKDMDVTQAKYDKYSDSQRATIDKAVEEALNGEVADLEDELIATTERLRRKTPTFLFKVKTLAEIQAVFPAFADNQQVFDAVGALPGDEVPSTSISVAVDLGDLASGGGTDIKTLMEAFFEVTASYKEDGVETTEDVSFDTDYSVASDFDENNVGSYTIGYNVDENYDGDIEDLKNMGTHLGASKFAYVVISDVDPVFGDPANDASADSSDGFRQIDSEDFMIEEDILKPDGTYDPNNAVADSLSSIEIWYGATKIKFGAFADSTAHPDAVEPEDVGTKVELEFYHFDQVQNAWIPKTEYTEIDDLEHLITTAGSYQIRVVFTNQSGDEFLVGGTGVEFTINTADIAPPTVRFNSPYYTYNFGGVGANVATTAAALTYGFDGQPSAATSQVIFFDNITSFADLRTGTYLLFKAEYINKLSAGAQAVCQDMGTYRWNGTGKEMNVTDGDFTATDKMCDVSLMTSEYVEENLLIDSQDNFKLVVTAGDEKDNWGYGINEVRLTNTGGIDIDFIGGQGTQSDPVLLDSYQSIYTTSTDRLKESLYDLATVSSNDLKWVADIKKDDPELFTIAPGEHATYSGLVEYTYTLSDKNANVNSGSIWVRFIDTTAPEITTAPKVLADSVAPVIQMGTDATKLLNANITDNDHEIFPTSGTNIVSDHVESISFEFVNSNTSGTWTTLTNDGTGAWANIPESANWTSAQAKMVSSLSNGLNREMNISDHYALMKITYNVRVVDGGGNELIQQYVIPQVKVYDKSRPVLSSYAGTVNASALSAGYITLDQWNLPYSTNSAVQIRNQMVGMDYHSSVTGLKTNTIGANHINTCGSTIPSVSFYWISQDLNRVDHTPDYNTYPVNSDYNGTFWQAYNNSGYATGNIGSISYNLTHGADNGFVSGNGAYLYQNYNGTGLSLILVPTFNTGLNHVIQSDIRYNVGQNHWNQYANTGIQQDHDYLAIQQKVDVGRYNGVGDHCNYNNYWNDYYIYT